MALRKTIVKRLVNKSCIYGYRVSSPAVTLEHSPSAHTLVPPNAIKTNSHREYITSPEFTDKGFFHKILQRRNINQSASSFPHFLWAPVGEKMREKLRNINIAGDRLRLDGLAPSLQDPKTEAAMETTGGSLYGLTVDDARKLLRLSQMEKLKLKLRETQKNSISYNEFVRFCIDSCENESQGVEFAKSLDESGNVIVLGSIVFLRPEQVAKSMESIISETVATPNDPRRKELEKMEMQKAIIDQKAKAQVRGELYFGLGFLTVQTLGFMRLTFWELSWDVMEPICFFVSSLDVALAYGFFLRTSTEPTFEGYFHRRFKSRQKKLMRAHNFDEEKYNHLRKLFYPAPEGCYGHALPSLHHFKASWGNVSG